MSEELLRRVSKIQPNFNEPCIRPMEVKRTGRNRAYSSNFDQDEILLNPLERAKVEHFQPISEEASPLKVGKRK